MSNRNKVKQKFQFVALAEKISARVALRYALALSRRKQDAGAHAELHTRMEHVPSLSKSPRVIISLRSSSVELSPTSLASRCRSSNVMYLQSGVPRRGKHKQMKPSISRERGEVCAACEGFRKGYRLIKGGQYMYVPRAHPVCSWSKRWKTLSISFCVSIFALIMSRKVGNVISVPSLLRSLIICVERCGGLADDQAAQIRKITRRTKVKTVNFAQREGDTTLNASLFFSFVKPS